MKCWATPFFIRAVKIRKCCDCRVQSLYFSDLLFQSYPAFGRLLLYSDKVFLGCLDCIQAVPDSVCNLNGPHGQLNSKTSIWNKLRKYGSPDSPQSQWSGSRKGPLMVDQHGTVFGRFQVNPEDGYTQSIKLMQLYEDLNRDLSKVRENFCQDWSDV